MSEQLNSIKVMADYCSSGLWSYDSGVMIEPTDLGLSESTIAELKSWVSYFNTNAATDVTQDDDIFDVKTFTERGRRIATLIKEELPNTVVYYFNESQLEQDIGTQMLQDSAAYLELIGPLH